MYPETRDAYSGEVEMVLSILGKNFKRYDSKNLRVSPAPCCRHDPKNNTPAFSITIDKGLWNCYACGEKGNWVTFCKLVNYHLKDATVERFVVNYTREWESLIGTKTVTPVTKNKYPELLKYCNDRGISDETLNDFRVVSNGSESLEFPLFAWNEDAWKKVSSRVVGVLGESKGKNRFGISGGPTHLLIGNHLFNPTASEKRAYIFEGQWDVMTAYELGLRNVFSLPNGASHVHCASMLQYIPEDWEIYVCMDMDEAGNKATISFFRQIPQGKFRTLKLPHKDLNDWYKAEPSLTKEDVLNTVTGLDFGENKTYEINTLDFMHGEIEEETPLTETPWKSLNEYLDGGFYPGQITSLLAPTGSGKTTIVNQLAMYSANKGVKTALISLEDTASKLKKKLRLLADGMDFKTKNASLISVTQLSGQHTKHEDVILSVDQFIKTGHKFIIVDNVNHLSGTISQQLETFRALMNLVTQKDCHAILVVQPNKIDAFKKEVNSGDMKGFSEIIQGVWNHINLNRDSIDDNLRIVHVEKCRNNGPGSRAHVFVKYDVEKNLYLEELSYKIKRQKCPLQLLRKEK